LKRRLLFLCFAPIVWAQNRAPAFDVTVVRPMGPTEASKGLTIDGGRIRISGFSLQSVILHAYQLKEYQLVGSPGWLATDRFYIEATLPRNTTEDQLPIMLQGLLTDRFMLKAHRVTRDQTVYAIVVDRGGLKVKERTGEVPTRSAEPPSFRAFSGSLVLTNPADPGQGGKFVLAGGDLQILLRPIGGLHIQASRISGLVELLSRCSDKPVVDRTTLKGSYQIDLDVTDDRMDDLLSVVMAPPGANLVGPDSSKPADAGFLREIVKGLGLNVESRSEPVETLVIDSIEKKPTAN
jgi:uncharacterized protein (TIGR03435 family)